MGDNGDLFTDVQNVLRGRSEREVLQVLLKSLVVALGVAAKDKSHAESVIDALPSELKTSLAANWTDLRRHRANADLIAKIERPLAPH